MKKVLLVVSMCAVLLSCDKDDDNDIPNVLVDFIVNIAPNATALNAPGGWVYVSGGVKGIVIYRHTLDEFFAIERNCSYQPSSGNAVTVDSTGIFLHDTGCGSRFYMTDGGSVANGPATRSLKRYNATFDGVNSVHVYN
jgi:hypothetical protein